MKLSQSLLEILRTQGHSTKLSMSIYKPPTLLACLVNSATIGRGARSIPFDTVSAGAFGNVYANAIMYIGTTAGAMDVGRIRVRSITSSVITVAENSDIDWANNLFLTVVDFIEISAIYPRIIKDPVNDENVIFYKDYDIVYTNQNSVLGTFVCMGSHRAADLDGGTVQLYWSSSGTYNVKGDALTYLWEFGGFGGASSGTSTSPDPGYITYDTCGEYKTKLTVTNASGGTDISYRYVSIHSPTCPPILKWEIDSLSGSRDSGGYVASMKVFEDITAVHPNALVVIYADDWYGTNHLSLGGNQVNNSKTVFVGYVLENSIKYNYEAGYVEFSVGSPTELMKLAEGFSISVESAVTAATWFQIDNMTTSKAIYHYLKTHSTVSCVTDLRYVADNRLVQYYDSDRTSLFDAIDNFLKTGMIGGLISDRQGTLWAEIHPPAIDNAFTAIPNVLTLEKRDWMESPSIGESRYKKVSFVELGGISYTGATTNTFMALLSNAPGTAPSYQGRTENPYPGLILTSQNQLNWIAGNYLEYQNAQYPDVTIDFVGNYRNLDIAPVESILMSLSPDDTFSKIQFSSKYFHITSMDWSYNAETETFIPSINFHEITEGIYGETIVIPEVPPDEGYTYPDYDIPEFPFNPIVLPDIVIPETGTQKTVIVRDSYRHGLFYTDDFESIEPTWYNNNVGLGSGTYLNSTTLRLSPSNEIYLMGAGVDENSVWYTESPDKPYRSIFGLADFQSGFADLLTVHGGFYATYYANFVVESLGMDDTGRIALMTSATNIGRIAIGNSGGVIIHPPPGDPGDWFEVGQIRSSSPGVTLGGSLTYGGGKWIASIASDGIQEHAAILFNDDGSINELTVYKRLGGFDNGFHSQLGFSSSALFRHIEVGTDELSRTDDNFANSTDLGITPPVIEWAVDITGQYFMGVSGNNLYRSSDGGITWEDITTSLPNYPLFFPKKVTCIDGNQWIVGGSFYVPDYLNTRINIIFSGDFGTTWVSKMGNLGDFLAASGTVDGYSFNMIEITP